MTLQKRISQHVMKGYQSKHQSGKESNSRGKAKEVMKCQGDKEAVISTNTPSSYRPIRESSVHFTLAHFPIISNQNTGLHARRT